MVVMAEHCSEAILELLWCIDNKYVISDISPADSFPGWLNDAFLANVNRIRKELSRHSYRSHIPNNVDTTTNAAIARALTLSTVTTRIQSELGLLSLMSNKCIM